MTEPRWVTDARQYIGLSEIPGATTAPPIQRWLRTLGAWWDDDETPWCGTFVAAMMKPYAPLPKHWYRARGWLDWGVVMADPDLGCIVVFERAGGGHVGFVVGRDLANNLLVLGGNQSNKVSIAAFSRTRVIGYRRPDQYELMAAALPLGHASASRSEA